MGLRYYIETERLILRDLLPTDVDDMFALDSNADVHKYLGNNPITTVERAAEVIAIIRQQYIDNEIGRWATIEKASGKFIGWSGSKFMREPENGHVDFYDVGYRLLPQFWGKGYATESAKAALEYVFTNFNADEVIGTAHEENKASRRALEKCGLKFVEQFMWKDLTCDWLTISRKEWENLKQQQ